MKRIHWFVMPFCALFVADLLAAATYRIQYDFQSLWQGGNWNGSWYEEPGLPKLPIIQARVLLRPGEAIASAHFEVNESGDFKKFDFPATPYSIPTCAGDWRMKPADEFVEGESFPVENMGDISIVKKFGYSIAQVPLFAVKYFPATQDGITIDHGELIIETKSSSRELDLYRGFQEDLQTIATSIDNPDNLAQYPDLKRVEVSPNYLAIGPKAFLEDDALAMFLSEKIRRGLTTTALSLEEIEASYSGNDLQEKIRKAVTEHYQKHATKYVLLIGNGYSLLPTRKVNVSGESIATDMYFGCLDDNGPPKDLACEVAVGRAPVSTLAEFRTFLSKTLKMELIDTKDPRIQNELNFGEEMNSNTLASDAIHQVLTGGKAGNLTTKGYPDSINATKLYETHSKKYNASQVIETINKGDFYTINHMGHSSETYCMRFNTSYIASLSNNLPFFGISGGCHPGNINGPNWAAKLITSPTGGAGALIANSSFGWFSPGTSDGPSNRHLLVFYDSVFNEGIYNLGLANARSKERLIPQANSNSTMRKVLVETNLLGDPELVLKIQN